MPVIKQICHHSRLRLPVYLFGLLMTTSLLSGCGLSRVESENFNSRVSIVVIHFTSGNFKSSLHALTRPSCRPVSSHYLIAEPQDTSYDEESAKTFQLVAESGRAWHAGVSSWAGKSGLNDQSIGIELVNRGYCYAMGTNQKKREMAAARENTAANSRAVADGKDFDPDACPRPAPRPEGEKPETLCFYPDFDEGQLELLVELLDGILERHPDIRPTHIIGHSDIAPDRKVDPGPRFPWQRLAKMGYGAWYDDEAVIRYWEIFKQAMPDLLTIQRALATYGYGIEATGEMDEQTRNVLRAFQMHFWPHQVTEEISPEMTAALFALIEKYYPEKLDLLISEQEQTVVSD